MSNFSFIKHQIISKGISKHFCTVKSDLMPIGLKSQWMTKWCQSIMPTLHFTPHHLQTRLRFHIVVTGWRGGSLPMLVSIWDRTQRKHGNPKQKQEVASKTFIERPPRGVSMFWRPGGVHVGLCCALVLTSLHLFHCRNVTVNILQVQTGFLGSGFWQKQICLLKIIASRKWISALWRRRRTGTWKTYRLKIGRTGGDIRTACHCI